MYLDAELTGGHAASEARSSLGADRLDVLGRGEMTAEGQHSKKDQEFRHCCSKRPTELELQLRLSPQQHLLQRDVTDK